MARRYQVGILLRIEISNAIASGGCIFVLDTLDGRS
jgi:hypothetical protein